MDLTPTGRISKSEPAEVRRRKHALRLRLARKRKAEEQGRQLRSKSPNGQGMTPEQRRLSKMVWNRQARQVEAAREGRALQPYRAHRCDAHVKQWKAHVSAEKKRMAEKHDGHVREWKADPARVARWKYDHDERYALYHRLKRWMHKHLGNNLPSRKWSQHLGYTVDELKTHIEKQFRKGMGWHNRGEWHVDHIVPVASFQIDSVDSPDFKACFCLANLRPMWGKDNIRKGAKRVSLL